MSLGKVTGLFIYPVKSCQAQAMQTLSITAEGPEGDRQWMLIDDHGTFLSQRTVPKLATVQVFLNEQGLNLGLGKQFFVAPAKSAFRRAVSVDVFGNKFEAALEADLFSQAISQYLGISCRLVRYAPFSKRLVGDNSTLPSSEFQTEVRFADSRPLLLLNTRSLEDLNQRLAEPVGMDRFRGNLIFDGNKAYEEDTFTRIKVGEVVFSQPKKCARCKIVTIDQATGASTGPEPLKTLSTYRRDGNKVHFGVLWIPENPGTIKRGDSIEVLC
jgi:uncharacterized protein YcbX